MEKNPLFIASEYHSTQLVCLPGFHQYALCAVSLMIIFWHINSTILVFFCHLVSHCFHHICPTHTPTPISSAAQCSTCASSESSVYITWPDTFQMHWGSMPVCIENATASVQRPSHTDSCHMITALADELQNLEGNTARLQCLTVAHKKVRQ